jgi:hypothetical protein
MIRYLNLKIYLCRPGHACTGRLNSKNNNNPNYFNNNNNFINPNNKISNPHNKSNLNNNLCSWFLPMQDLYIAQAMLALED